MHAVDSRARGATYPPADNDRECAMTGSELKAIRHRLGLSCYELGQAFGYAGNHNTVSSQVRKYEEGARPVPPWIGRLATMFDRFGIPEDLTPEPPDTERTAARPS